MRRTYDSDLIFSGKRMLGFKLGADACSEHEWGIAKLKTKFGCIKNGDKPEILGVDRRRVTTMVDMQNGFYIKDKDRKFYLSSKKNYSDWNELKACHPSELDGFVNKKGFNACWDDSDFAIATLDKDENVAHFKDILKAFRNFDAMFIYGSGMPWVSGGLQIIIVSRLSDQERKEIYETDLDNRNLHEAALKTGIEGKLKAADKHFFALSPAWANEEKTEVRFWLNPQEQHKNNYGWYNVEQLTQWIDGKGPIPKARS